MDTVRHTALSPARFENFWEDRVALGCEVLDLNELPRPLDGALSHTPASGRSAARTG